MSRLYAFALASVFLLRASQASAHAVIDRNEAAAGSYFKVVVAIAHGCEGSPTLKMRVRIPEGILTVRPQPKPGWELAMQKQKLAAPIKGPHGSSITEAVTEVTWSGRLPDDNFDEFVMQVLLPDKPGETLYFATVQECERGVNRWIEIPAAGKSSRDLAQPAPSVKILPKRHAH
jgi:uncharacterized protein YcnI